MISKQEGVGPALSPPSDRIPKGAPSDSPGGGGARVLTLAQGRHTLLHQRGLGNTILALSFVMIDSPFHFEFRTKLRKALKEKNSHLHTFIPL